MKNALIIFVFLLISVQIFAQGCEWRMSVMGGLNRVFLGPKPQSKRSGASIFYSTGFVFKNRKSTFTIEPSLAYGRNTYALETTNAYVVDVKQNSYFSLILIAGFKIKNNLFYKIGCLVNTDLTAQGNRLYAQYNSYNPNGVDFDMPAVYYPTETQVSLVSGLTLFCDKEQKIAIDLQAQQNINGVLDQNFYVEQHWQSNPGSVLIANKKSKPIILLIGLNIKVSTLNCFKSTKARYNKLKQKPYGIS